MTIIHKLNKSWLLALLILAWLLPGLIGRDPWKADEPYTVGLVWHIVETGDWVVPTLGGEPFMEKPPVYFITAACFTKCFSWLLAPHEAARLASAFFLGITLLCVGLASRRWYGDGKGQIAALLLIGCVGLIHTAHFLITDNALLAGFAVALYGLSLCGSRPWLGGMWLGTGTGLAFMAKGILGPAFLGLTAGLLPILFRAWRTRAYLGTLIAALLALLPWLVVWPAMLYARSPALFNEWFWVQNWDRFAGSGGGGPSQNHFLYFHTLPWFAWPAFPLVVWLIYRERRGILADPTTQAPLLLLVLMFVIFSASTTGRSLYAVPMLAPFCLLAARLPETLPERLAKGLTIFSLGFFGLAIAGAWLGWLAQFTGVPAMVLQLMHKSQPNFTPEFHWQHLLGALLLTGFWLVCILPREEAPWQKWLLSWAGGLVCFYGLIMTLWLPYAEVHASYRPFLQLRDKIPPGQLVLSQGLGEPQRGLLHYYINLKTRRIETLKGQPLPEAAWFLCQLETKRDTKPKLPPGDWTVVWQLNHRGKEQFLLFHQAPTSPPPRAP